MAQWSKEDVEKLIELFHAEPDLWDIKSANYSKKDYRLRSLETVKEGLEDKYTGEYYYFLCFYYTGTFVILLTF
jgi:hypothetical protein